MHYKHDLQNILISQYRYIYRRTYYLGWKKTRILFLSIKKIFIGWLGFFLYASLSFFFVSHLS